MGFNVGVHSKQEPDNFDCYHFIERKFYNFVNSGEMYGEESILIQSGKYYGLDLSPLCKLVYTWDEVPEEYVNENTQNTDFLLELTLAFRNKIQNDPSVCDKIKYVWREDHASSIYGLDIAELNKALGEDGAKLFMDAVEDQKKEAEENPDPWKSYFDEGTILTDIGNLIKSLQCYKDKGVTEVYLTAG